MHPLRDELPIDEGMFFFCTWLMSTRDIRLKRYRKAITLLLAEDGLIEPDGVDEDNGYVFVRVIREYFTKLFGPLN